MASVGIWLDSFGIKAISGGTIKYPRKGADEDAVPLLEGSPVVIYPQATGMGGNNIGLRIVGRPMVVVRRNWISKTGFAWYWDWIIGSIPTEVYIQVYSMRDDAWNVYKATMNLPTHSNVSVASGTNHEIRLAGFECIFTNLVQQTKVWLAPP